MAVVESKVCPFCHKTFTVEEYGVMHFKNRIFCSSKCYAKYHKVGKKGKVKKTCEVCGAQFLGYDYVTRLGNKGYRYCSVECRYKARKLRKVT